MAIPKSLARRFEDIALFGNVGQAGADIDSWHQAWQLCADPSWEEFTLEQANELALSVRRTSIDDYNDLWNDRVREIKTEILRPLVLPAIRKLELDSGIAKLIGDQTSWDLLHAAMDLWFRPNNEANFHRRMLKIYEQGHFPCGTTGAQECEILAF